jgi:hypothetical protein
MDRPKHIAIALANSLARRLSPVPPTTTALEDVAWVVRRLLGGDDLRYAYSVQTKLFTATCRVASGTGPTALAAVGALLVAWDKQERSAR